MTVNHESQSYDPTMQAPPAAPRAAQPAPAPAPRPVSPAELRKLRQARQRGTPFSLEDTSKRLRELHDDPALEVTVDVRKPDLAETDALLALPEPLQRAVLSLVEEAEKGAFDAPAGQALSDGEIVKRMGTLKEMASAYCLLGFVNPRCHATAEEADREDGLYVEDIAAADRLAFFNYCTEGITEAAKVVEPFRPQPVAAVGDGPAGDPLPGAGQSEPGAPVASDLTAAGV